MPTYVRLRSVRTGHTWDARSDAAATYLASGGVEVVARLTPHTAARPRPPKYLRDLAGRPARPRRRPSTRTKE